MYFDVSPEYLYTMINKATRRRLSGTIGNKSFSGADVIRDSFEISNRCAEDSDMKIGGVYIGQLNLTFVPSFVNKVSRKNFIGKVITPYIGLYVPDNDEWEDIPLGVYTIKSAAISKDGITIEAFDNMSKVDKPFYLDVLYGSAYNLLKVISQECGVELGVTKDFVESLPNGQEELYLIEENDIETFRDLLYWVAQTTGTFATINRAGQLELRKFGLATTELDETNRDVDAVYYDYVTKYTAITMDDFDSGEVQIYALVPNDGLTMNLGANPLLQTVADHDTQDAIAYVEGQIDECDRLADEIEDEIEALDAQIDYVEEQIRQHPDDPDLKAQLALLESQKAVKEDEARENEKAKADLEKELEDLEKGLVDKSKIFKKKARREVLKAVNKIQYTPFAVTSARDCIFDLGDKIILTGGMANDEAGCVMYLSYKLDSYSFEGYGGNPELADSRSSTDKSVTGAKKSQKVTEPIDFATYVNVDPVVIRKQQEIMLGQVRFGVAQDVDVETWIELKIKTNHTTDRKNGFRLTYYLDEQEITAYHPVEEWGDLGIKTEFDLDGTTLVFSSSEAEPESNYHTVNFQYHLHNVSQSIMHTWKVVATGTGGTEIIDTECCHIVVWGQGLKGEDDWAGLVSVNDSFPVYPIKGMSLFGTIRENVGTSISGESDALTTENGDTLTTENGDKIITE